MAFLMVHKMSQVRPAESSIDIISGGRESFFIFIRLTFAIAMRLLHIAVSIQIGTNVSQFFPVKYFQCETHKQFVSNLLV